MRSLASACPRRKLAKELPYHPKIWIVGVWSGSSSLAKVERAGTKIAIDSVLVGAAELCAKIEGMASLIPQPVVGQHNPQQAVVDYG